MALGDYILCCKCGVKLIYDGDRSQREWLEERFGKESGIECPDCKPKREWQGLTDNERMELAVKTGAMSADWLPFMEAVEKKLKEKNEERI